MKSHNQVAAQENPSESMDRSSGGPQYGFILALGRSGTQFLARMLNHDASAEVFHEPYAFDPAIMHLRHSGFHAVADQMMSERFQKLTGSSAGKEKYIETNSYLRYEAPWLRSQLNAKLVRLVRDGRSFVCSAYVRDVYTPYDIQLPVVPHDEDPFASEWGAMNRFEKICWYWQHSNKMLAEQIPEGVHMEDLLKDYDVFQSEILTPLGLDVDEATWKREVARPANTKTAYRVKRALKVLAGRSPKYKRPDPLPHWREWPSELKDSFARICGETMEQMGYSL